MIKDKSIFIKNIYYMLSYAYQNLQQNQYEQIETEEFDNIHDLFSSILAKGIATQLKRGLVKEYIEKEDTLSTLRGKIGMTGSIRLKMQQKNQLLCQFDELSENHHMNQILKTTVYLLIGSDQVKAETKSNLKKLMLYFSDVEKIEPSSIRWDSLRYHRHNQTYRMLMNICYLVIEGLLLSTDKGKQRLATFMDGQMMSRLYEKFVLEYYRKHYPNLRAKPSQIMWNVDDDIRDFLPVMQTDITLTYKDKVLIIDTKYYGQAMQTQQYDSQTLRSNHMYQIFAYVKNKDKHNTGKVSGMLLYAKTDEEVLLDYDYVMSGNKISVKTLDLNRNFSRIAWQLDCIAEDFVSE